MADKPIIFSAPMVRALLAGRKTQTRRVIKPQPTCERPAQIERGVRFAVGDRLWVRESFALVPPSAYRMSEGVQQTVNPDASACQAAIYAAGWERSKPHWKPSIHMPRWASRLTLGVTAVRIERLQSISDADARAEGVRVLPLQDAVDPSAWWEVEPGQHQARTPSESFRSLWTSINGADSWAANPWVAAISFEVKANA